MLTVRQLFETDNGHTVSADKTITVCSEDNETKIEIPIRLHYDISGGVRYFSVFVARKNTKYLDILLQTMSPSLNDFLLPAGIRNVKLPSASKIPRGFNIGVGNFETLQVLVDPKDGGEIDAVSLPFSGRIFLYTEENISIGDQDLKYLRDQNIHPRVRGPEYVELLDVKPRAFISHDSRDKDEVARPIAQTLQQMLCPVWYDEYSLKVGDSLRESIEKGLKETKFCILILTSNFLASGGWPKNEYTAAFTKEMVEDRKVILPVWCGVSRDNVFQYSPILADKYGLQYSEDKREEVCRKLFLEIEGRLSR